MSAHEGNGSSNGNGEVVRLHPEAVESLAKTTAGRLADDERWIERIDNGIADIRAGRTEWQRSTDNKLTLLADSVLAVRMAHFAWPPMVAIAALFLGGFGAVLVWLITKH